MAKDGFREPPAQDATDVDENGVDLTQIREMLDKTPLQRLECATGFVNDLLAIRARNENLGPR
jgi:hypothetical protein